MLAGGATGCGRSVAGAGAVLAAAGRAGRLGRLYPKLGIRSRVELARVLGIT
ncbi:hypothetical protein [Micromonospora sp. NPDC051296]|uniref:hypothetical protein n=1 Tax=Micromonospora sp. NPDC051296 TaxID=3155046 RepID=UPI00342B212E